MLAEPVLVYVIITLVIASTYMYFRWLMAERALGKCQQTLYETLQILRETAGDCDDSSDQD